MWRYVLAWVPMVFLAIANGTLRQVWYAKYLGEIRAHQLSTVTLVLALGVYIWAVIRLLRPHSPTQAVMIGLIWCILTVGFEFIFGHYIAGHPWSRLLQDYNLSAGRIWGLILLWITLAPYTCYRLQS